MADFTIFRNTKTGACTAVYDRDIPTQTGIGEKRFGYRFITGKPVGYWIKLDNVNCSLQDVWARIRRAGNASLPLGVKFTQNALAR